MRAEDEMGRIFHLQRYSVEDGEGIRTTVFLKGCPLSCVWCHNAESLSRDRELAFAEQSCISCRLCAVACGNGCHRFSGQVHLLDRQSCTVCGRCAVECPTGALRVVGEDITAGAVFRLVLRDRCFYRNGGGVTLSGGEPMAQAAFSTAVAALCRDAGISVNVETSGCCAPETLLTIAPYVDTFLYDCKADREWHRMLTGVEEERILKNLDLLAGIGAKIVLRCPVVPGGNLREAFLDKIADLADRYEAILSVTLLPYHRTGTGKSKTLGHGTQAEFSVPTPEKMHFLRELLLAKIHRRIRVDFP